MYNRGIRKAKTSPTGHKTKANRPRGQRTKEGASNTIAEEKPAMTTESEHKEERVKMATAVELIKEHIPDPNKINYNPVVHGPDGLTEEVLHQLAVRRWLVNLTGEESPEDVVAVTSYGWELGLSGSFMLPQISKDIPFERLRIDTINELSRNELSRITYGK